MRRISLYTAQKIIIFSILLTHICYFFIFLFMKEEILAVTNVFSVATYLFLLRLIYDSPENNKITMVIVQLEILFHALVCMLTLGWGYGFGLLFLASSLILFFTSFTYKFFNYIIVAVQIILSIACYVYLDGQPVKDFDGFKDLLFVFNLSMVCIFSVVVSYLLESSNLFIFLSILEEKEMAENILNHDPLTGLLNRTSMQKILSQNDLYKNRDFAIVMCDIDNFKKINDTYGHGAGDAVLRSLSGIFKNTFRDKDRVARFGGEEFLAVVLGVKKDAAVSIVERVRETLSKNIVEFENIKINATMTFGVVAHDGTGEFSLEKMIKQADNLLYAGKRSGKNIVMSADYDPKG